jgi:hypothetical protein|tara:strand:+ start:5191 stop:5613 length:423 start_codon:yes stop_codon:yes gene_type:complete
MVTLEQIKERYPEGCEVACPFFLGDTQIIHQKEISKDIAGSFYTHDVYLYHSIKNIFATIINPAPESSQENKKENMIVKIKPKDTTTPIYYKDVASHFQEGQTLALLFEDGSVRNIPFIHMWYYETKQPRERTKVENEIN